MTDQRSPRSEVGILRITEEDVEAFCAEGDRVRPDPNDQKAVNSFVSWLMAWKYEKEGLTW